MKILQLCKKFPYPLKDGESIAVTYLSKALVSKGCEITLLAMNTTKHFVDPDSIPDSYNHYKEIVFTSLDNRIKPFNALINLFSDQSYHVSRFVSKEFETKLIDLLKKNEFDVIQLETLYLASYIDIIREHSDAIIALRAHNIEFEIWERITQNTSFPVKKWYLSHLTKKLKKFELEKLNDYDYIISVSERDLKKFKQLGYKNGAMASPIGLEVENYKLIDNDPLPNSLCFIGALDWMPNVEGLNWFLKNVWPVLYHENQNLSFHVAGRNTPESLMSLNIPGVEIHGEVPDAIEFIGKHEMMVVPLFSGSGMRVKILEGMALGKPIVTTNLGKEGIDARHGEQLVVADDVSSFVNEIKNLFHNKEDMTNIGKAARLFVENFYDHSTIAQKLMKRYKELQTTYRKKPSQLSV